MGDIEYEMFDKDKQEFKKIKNSVIDKYGGRIGKQNKCNTTNYKSK